MSFHFTSSYFPCNSEQLQSSGLPFGALFTPLSPLLAHQMVSLPASLIERCSNCFGYINPYVHFSRKGWKCSLCRSFNFIKKESRIYEELTRHQLPELQQPLVEYSWTQEEQDRLDGLAHAATAAAAAAAHAAPNSLAAAAAAAVYNVDADDLDEDESAQRAAAPSAAFAPHVSSLENPIYLFVIDVSSSSSTYLDLIKSSLLAALEALSPNVWVGLAVFSNKLGLYELNNLHRKANETTPHIHYVRIRNSKDSTIDATYVDQLKQSSRSSSGSSSSGSSGSSSSKSSSFPAVFDHDNSTLGPLNLSPTNVPLSSVLPLKAFLGRLGNVKDIISAAIEAIHSHYPQTEEQTTTTPTPTPTPTPTANATASATAAPFQACGFGGALSALLNYLTEDNYDLNIRILSFLTNIPNYGLGKLPIRYQQQPTTTQASSASQDTSDKSSKEKSVDPNEQLLFGEVAHHTSLLKPATDFYQQLATYYATRGICFDLFTFQNDKYLDLASLKYLSVLTGGNLSHYDSFSDSTLPQDLFRQLRAPHAFRCLLRLRTSPEFCTSAVYGHLCCDAVHDSLFHISSCDPAKTFGLELAYHSTSSAAFLPTAAWHSQQQTQDPAFYAPVVQLAFSYVGYATSPAALAHSADGAGSLGPETERLVHKLRVHTVRLNVAQHAAELYRHLDEQALCALLAHQFIHTSLEMSVQQARESLLDWFVHFAACYHEVAKHEASRTIPSASSAAAAAAAASGAKSEEIDLSFTRAALPNLLPFLYAFLQHDLTSHYRLAARPLVALPPAPATAARWHAQPRFAPLSPDARIALQCLFSALEPRLLVKHVLPRIHAYLSPAQPIPAAAAVDSPHDHASPQFKWTAAIFSTVITAKVCVDDDVYLQHVNGGGGGGGASALAPYLQTVQLIPSLFVVDTLTHIFIVLNEPVYQQLQQHYQTLQAQGQPAPKLWGFPPLANSELQRHVKRLKNAAPYLTPRVVACRGSPLAPNAVQREEEAFALLRRYFILDRDTTTQLDATTGLPLNADDRTLLQLVQTLEVAQISRSQQQLALLLSPRTTLQDFVTILQKEVQAAL